MSVGQPYMVSAIRTRRFTITIPASAGVATTIEALVAAVAAVADAPDLTRVLGAKIESLLTAGTNRPAILVGDAIATCIQYIAAGASFNEPSINEYKEAYIKAAANATIDAVVVLYIG